jgi:hypothetical protein
MTRIILATSILGVLIFSVFALPQNSGFILVEGQNLRAKLENAIKMYRASGLSARFWAAYSFDIRPGVAVDPEIVNPDGSKGFLRGGLASVDPASESRKVAIFFLYEPGGDHMIRAAIHNLDRGQDYENLPVYYLGHPDSLESLEFLKSVVDSARNGKMLVQVIKAISLHRDTQAREILQDYIRNASTPQQRSLASFWLGNRTADMPLLTNLIRDERESPQVRRQAAMAIGLNADPSAISTLQSLYDSAADREAKKQLLSAAFLNANKEAVSFLEKVANADPDPDLRKQAQFWLRLKTNDRGSQSK